MKNSFLFFSLTLLLFSCRKGNISNNSNTGLLSTPYYFTCTAGGFPMSFTSSVSCHLPTGKDTMINGSLVQSLTFSLTGTVNATSGALIQIQINGSPNFTIGTNSYVYPTTPIGCFYMPSNTNPVTGVNYWGGADSLNYSTALNKFKLTVTSIDNKNNTIKGNFEGVLGGGFDQSTLKTDTISITNGQFYIPYNIP